MVVLGLWGCGTSPPSAPPRPVPAPAVAPAAPPPGVVIKFDPEGRTFTCQDDDRCYGGITSKGELVVIAPGATVTLGGLPVPVLAAETLPGWRLTPLLAGIPVASLTASFPLVVTWPSGEHGGGDLQIPRWAVRLELDRWIQDGAGALPDDDAAPEMPRGMWLGDLDEARPYLGSPATVRELDWLLSMRTVPQGRFVTCSLPRGDRFEIRGYAVIAVISDRRSGDLIASIDLVDDHTPRSCKAARRQQPTGDWHSTDVEARQARALDWAKARFSGK
jgi:hypothetical protein